MRILSSVIYFFLLHACFSAEEPLIVGMELEYPPFEFVNENGVNDGVSVQLAKALAESLERPLEI